MLSLLYLDSAGRQGTKPRVAPMFRRRLSPSGMRSRAIFRTSPTNSLTAAASSGALARSSASRRSGSR